MCSESMIALRTGVSGAVQFEPKRARFGLMGWYIRTTKNSNSIELSGVYIRLFGTKEKALRIIDRRRMTTGCPREYVG